MHIQHPTSPSPLPVGSCSSLRGNSLGGSPAGCPKGCAVAGASSRVSPSLWLLQGLEVEQMATYEDITPFRDVKAKWTVGEHPGEE